MYLNELNVSPAKTCRQGVTFWAALHSAPLARLSGLQNEAKSIFRIPSVYYVCGCYQTQTGNEKRAIFGPFHFQMRLQSNSQYYLRKQNKMQKKIYIYVHQTVIICFITLVPQTRKCFILIAYLGCGHSSSTRDQSCSLPSVNVPVTQHLQTGQKTHESVGNLDR